MIFRGYSHKIKFSEETKKYRKLLDLAESILDACLTTTQKRRYLLAKYHELTTREIALMEKVSQTAVCVTIKAAEARLKQHNEVGKKKIF